MAGNNPVHDRSGPGRRIALLIFALVWFSCAYFGSWVWNPNHSTRLFGAISLVEEGDATIDQFQHLTIDRAQFGGNYYMDKPPGMTLMAVPTVALVNAITGARSSQFVMELNDPGLDRYFLLRMRLAIIFSSALLTALAAACLYLVSFSLTGNRAASAFAGIGYALATPIWAWSTTLFGHAPVAALLIIAFAALRYVSLRSSADRRAVVAAAVAAAALAWAMVIEHHAVFAVIAILIYGWLETRHIARPDRMILVGCGFAAGLVFALPLPLYNLAAFGSPFRVGYEGVVGFEGMQQGLLGLTYPKLSVLWEITFGMRRGILWFSPVLVLGAIGLWRMSRDPGTRSTALFAALIALIYWLLNASYVYWDGGNSSGPRHAMPGVGFIALGLAGFWSSLRSNDARGFALAFLTISWIFGLLTAAAEPMAFAEFKFPLYEDIFQRFSAGSIHPIPVDFWGWSAWPSLALYLAVAAALGFLLVRVIRAQGEAAPRARETISCRGPLTGPKEIP